MTLTLSSVFSTLLFNNLLIIIIYFMLKNYKFILCIGIKLILFCMFFITIRFFFPFNFSFMRPISIKKILPPIFTFLRNTPLFLFHYKIYLIDILAFIWITGIILISLKAFISYFEFGRKVNTFEIIADPKMINLLNQINANYQNKTSFRMVYNDILESPFIVKLKHPIIIIPKISLSEEDWFYILNHEIAHYYHNDLFYKVCVEILSFFYWWNPFIYLLKKQVENLLEINIDIFITKTFNDKQKLDYLDCLLKIIQVCKGHNHKLYSITAFYNSKTSIMSQRVNIILEHIRGTKPILQSMAIMVTIFIIYITCSFCLILEPYTIPVEDMGNSFEIIEEFLN